jgi:hypothetical protein
MLNGEVLVWIRFAQAASTARPFFERTNPFQVALGDPFDGFFTRDLTITQRDQRVPK